MTITCRLVIICICMLWSCDYHMQVGDYVYMYAMVM